jgi:hypothetical protein
MYKLFTFQKEQSTTREFNAALCYAPNADTKASEKGESLGLPPH